MNLSTLRRAALVLVASIATLAVAAPIASAHVTLQSTTPTAGSTVASPGSVKVTFSGPLRSGTITVKNASGTKVSIGTGARDPRNVNRISVAVKPRLAAGWYTVAWSIKAADGHSQSKTFRFKVR